MRWQSETTSISTTQSKASPFLPALEPCRLVLTVVLYLYVYLNPLCWDKSDGKIPWWKKIWSNQDISAFRYLWQIIPAKYQQRKSTGFSPAHVESQRFGFIWKQSATVQKIHSFQNIVYNASGRKTSNWEKQTIKRHSKVMKMWSSSLTCTANIKCTSGAEPDKRKL